jgi:hypothetical protein
MIRVQDEAIGSEPIGNRDRHLGVDGRLGGPHGRGRAGGELQIELVVGDAALEKLVEAEVADVVEDGVGCGRRYPRPLEGAMTCIRPPTMPSRKGSPIETGSSWRIGAERSVSP